MAFYTSRTDGRYRTGRKVRLFVRVARRGFHLEIDRIAFGGYR